MTSSVGETWPVYCVGGELVAPQVKPKPEVAARPVVISHCQAQSWKADLPEGSRWLNVKTFRTQVGSEVDASVVNTFRKVKVVCDTSGKFVLAPVVPSTSVEEDTAEWKRLFDQYQKAGK